MAVDYGAGTERRGAYANLARALSKKLDAQNEREAEDIRRRGLFGTGITQESLSGLANTGLAMANFGDQRKSSKLGRAKESFDRRMAGMQKRFDFYNARDDQASKDVARGLMDAMNKERSRFEKAYTDYDDMGMFESGFGGEGIAYKGADTQATEKKLLEQIMANRPQEQPTQLPGEGMMGGVTTPVQNYQGSGQTPASNMSPGFTRYDDMLSPREKAKRRNAMYDTSGVLNNYSLGSGYQA